MRSAISPPAIRFATPPDVVQATASLQPVVRSICDASALSTSFMAVALSTLISVAAEDAISNLSSWYRAALNDAGNPALHLPAIGGVFGAEQFPQPLFVMQHAAMKPDRARDQQEQREPRPECQRESGEENEMPEIHRVARVAIRTARDNTVRRHFHSRRAAGARQAIASDEMVLQISPRQQRQPPWHDREPAPIEHKLECDDDQRTQEEGLHGGPAQPAQNFGAYIVHCQTFLVAAAACRLSLPMIGVSS